MGRCSRFRRIHALPDVFLGLHAEVKLKFFIDALVDLSSPEQCGDFHVDTSLPRTAKHTANERRHLLPILCLERQLLAALLGDGIKARTAIVL